MKNTLIKASAFAMIVQSAQAVLYSDFNDNGVWFSRNVYNSESDFTPTIGGGINNSAGQNGWLGGGGDQTGVSSWDAGGSNNASGTASGSNFGTWQTTFVNRGNGLGLSNGTAATATSAYDVKANGTVLSSGNGYWFENAGVAGDFRDNTGHMPSPFGSPPANGFVQSGAVSGTNDGGWTNVSGMGTSSGGNGSEFSHGGVTVADSIPVLRWNNPVTDATYVMNFVNDYNDYGVAFNGGNWLNGSGNDIGAAETLILHFRAATNDYVVINHAIHNEGTFQNDVWDPNANSGAGGWVTNPAGASAGDPSYIPNNDIVMNPGDAILLTLRADEVDANKDIKFSWHMDSWGLYVDPDSVTTPVPEPTSAVFSLLGGMALILRRKK